ncbi:flocculation suppression protein [Diplodia corticola]|uniref:Flocculation suppression protein n=1 Tax=Diplodia corticola TaxID=236234 RepID=A0A1J9RIV8_9PEZI|nr:flocculation suppression protein [Diplodia corticola]OJD39962.1 flocculation suppression protein [Diplodia corticola]
MASGAESVRRSPFAADTLAPGMHKTIPILPSSSAASSLTPPVPAGDPMDVTPSNSTSAAPPSQPSPALDRNGGNQSEPDNSSQSSNQQQNSTGGAPTSNATAAAANNTTNGNTSAGSSNGPGIGAAAAAQQPKVVQTAFIHKLYNMLEDQSIQHLISWSSTNESFVMSPSNEFSKVLSSYFKHTNISSFVRQLNMYGFHKVSDVFHTGSPDSPLWEFKHGNGNFKRGDLVGLREIKRRASRHALIHRDSFSTGPKTAAPSSGAPVEPMPDPVESRLQMLEHSLYDMHARLARTEDSYAYVNQRCNVLTESLMRCHQWNYELSNCIKAMVPDPEHQIHKDVTMMQNEIARQSDIFRSMDEQQENIQSARSQYFSNLQSDSMAPASPRQMPQNDQRRPSLADVGRPGSYRGPQTAVPPHLQVVSPRRYGSITQGNYSPSSLRPPVQQAPPPPPPQIQHPLANVDSNSPPPNLSRRHTSADIRLHGWVPPPPPPPSHSPYASGHNSTPWPSSPHRAPLGGDEQLRNALAQYEITRGPRQHPGSRNATPPPNEPSSTLNPDAGWTLPGARFPFRGIDTPGPPTRRSSMASNVHSLLNPAETAERPDEDEPQGDLKRKRLL